MEDGSVLERRLNGEEDPADLPLALLIEMTKNFSRENKIGQGGFGEVYKGEHGEVIVAVKRIDVTVYTIDDQAFLREISSLMKTNHQNIVRFLGFCSTTYQKLI